MNLILTISLLVAAAMAQQNADDVLTTGNNQFTANMFSEVIKSNPGKSVVLSAFSVLTPLAQLSLASDGETHDELLKAIGVPSDNITKTAFPHLNEKLKSIKGIELKTASKIYVADRYELNPDFSANTKDIFKSEVKNVDFMKKDETAKEINSWVEDQTNKHIKDLVSADDFNIYTRSVLVNAIFFNGRWDTPFEKKNTKDEDFYVSKDKTIKVPMMHKRKMYEYSDSAELNAQLLEMHFLEYDASFIVILPKEIDGVDSLVEKLKNVSALESAMSKMNTFHVTVSLPKFKIETTTNLEEVLKKMDVKRIFDEQNAQLGRLIKQEERLYVSKAIQKTFIDVNELGVEAAAANELNSLISHLPFINNLMKSSDFLNMKFQIKNHK